MNLSPNDDDRLWRDSEKTSWFRFPNPLRYVVFLVVLICFLIGLWYLLAPDRQWYGKKELMLIQADQAPYKVKAESQGVPSVKHQDKLVYGRIRADQHQPVAEHILPDPESPLPQIKEEGTTIKMVEQYTPEDIDPDKIGASLQKKSKEEGPSLTSIEDLIDDSPEERQEPEKKIAKHETFIQLGSLKSYEMAESEWERLSQKHRDLLKGLEPVIQKIDLGKEQGIYYRLRTGPFDDIETANEMATNLKKREVDCHVVP